MDICFRSDVSFSLLPPDNRDNLEIMFCIFSSPGRSPGRAVVLTPAPVLAAASALAKCLSFYVKVFYVMGKALSGELSCPCDRSCSIKSQLLTSCWNCFCHYNPNEGLQYMFSLRNEQKCL